MRVGAATCNPILIRERSGTIGLPFPSTEIAILDDAGQPVPLGQPGEIAIRGPQVMAGYWQRPDETAKVMMSDGFFKSGDIGIMDERAGEAVKLFVVRKDPALTDADLMEYCKQQLTGYKRPKYIEFRDELPKSNIGKILRRALKESRATEAARSA